MKSLWIILASCLLATGLCAQVATITVTSDEPVASVAVTQTGADAYTLTLSGNAVYPAAAADPDVTLFWAAPVASGTATNYGVTYSYHEPAWCPYRAITVTGVVANLAANTGSKTNTFDVGYYTGATWTSLLGAEVSFTAAETGSKAATLATTPTVAIGKCVIIKVTKGTGEAGSLSGLTVRIAYQ